MKKIDCENCKEPTKFPRGFYDNADKETGELVGGFLFDCNNVQCAAKQSRIRNAAYQDIVKLRVNKINESNGVSIDEMKTLKRQTKLIIANIAKKHHLTSSQYSSYENLRQPMPPDTYDSVMGYLKEKLHENR